MKHLSKYDQEELIRAIVKMKIEKMASTKTIIYDFLMGEVGLCRASSYNYYKDAMARVRELWSVEDNANLEVAIGQMEELLEIAKNKKDYKLTYHIRTEMNKLLGLNIKKVDITSNGQPITEIKLIEIKSERKRDDGEDA